MSRADPAETIVHMAVGKGLLITTAESCTGGMVAAALTDIVGSSGMFERGVITYSNEVKTALLGVSVATLEAYGAVSEEVAAQMAAGARATAAADIAIAITGIAGPGGSEFKPEGRVCFGLADATGVKTQTVEFGAIGRPLVRASARDHALKLLLDAVQSS